MAYISSGYKSDTDTYRDTGDCGTMGPGSTWIVVASATAARTTTRLYICPNDLMILDPSVLDGIEPDFVITESVPVQFWPELYHEDPHTVPNYFEPAPKKIQPKTTNLTCGIQTILKQPCARMGFRRGNRM